MNRILAACLLLLFSPFLIYIIICIRLGSTGPVFFRQVRVGKDRKPFVIYKFRTMYHDPHSTGMVLTIKNDNRITSFGKKLRKYKLDELPQLWNIIKGDMNWVGMRPEQEYFVERLIETDPLYESLFSIKPGLTSLGVIKYGYAVDIEEMALRARYDFFYINHQSLKLKFYILLESVKIIYRRVGR